MPDTVKSKLDEIRVLRVLDSFDAALMLLFVIGIHFSAIMFYGFSTYFAVLSLLLPFYLFLVGSLKLWAIHSRRDEKKIAGTALMMGVWSGAAIFLLPFLPMWLRSDGSIYFAACSALAVMSLYAYYICLLLYLMEVIRSLGMKLPKLRIWASWASMASSGFFLFILFKPMVLTGDWHQFKSVLDHGFVFTAYGSVLVLCSFFFPAMVVQYVKYSIVMKYDI